MVGLSILLEPTAAKNPTTTAQNPQVINKATIHRPSSSAAGKSQRRHVPPPEFLRRCFLCQQELLAGKDIYMYKGDKGFCSVECRCRQMFMDEDEGFPSCRSGGAGGNKNPPAGRFAY